MVPKDLVSPLSCTFISNKHQKLIQCLLIPFRVFQCQTVHKCQQQQPHAFSYALDWSAPELSVFATRCVGKSGSFWMSGNHSIFPQVSEYHQPIIQLIMTVLLLRCIHSHEKCLLTSSCTSICPPVLAWLPQDWSLVLGTLWKSVKELKIWSQSDKKSWMQCLKT